ncbi:hypothetical protein PR048_027655 [Dryococelus australis]|uniref:DNA polymerase n=1 Tax=Dryococelus australis TaxID=614101 RepID=A0ABQ9GH44_9NEOP|nr:hypothetical protein PR048_027655 [Dryococelus australis]
MFQLLHILPSLGGSATEQFNLFGYAGDESVDKIIHEYLMGMSEEVADTRDELYVEDKVDQLTQVIGDIQNLQLVANKIPREETRLQNSSITQPGVANLMPTYYWWEVVSSSLTNFSEHKTNFVEHFWSTKVQGNLRAKLHIEKFFPGMGRSPETHLSDLSVKNLLAFLTATAVSLGSSVNVHCKNCSTGVSYLATLTLRAHLSQEPATPDAVVNPSAENQPSSTGATAKRVSKAASQALEDPINSHHGRDGVMGETPTSIQVQKRTTLHVRQSSETSSATLGLLSTGTTMSLQKDALKYHWLVIYSYAYPCLILCLFILFLTTQPAAPTSANSSCLRGNNILHKNYFLLETTKYIIHGMIFLSLDSECMKKPQTLTTHYDLEKKLSTGKEVSILDVYSEFDKICPKYKILEFKSRKVERSYVFNVPNVPVTSEYLEVRYSASMPALPPDLEGETFSHVFGTTTSSLELLLLGRKIKGPCWLDVKAPQAVTNPLSWCKIEIATGRPENVSVSALTPLVPPPPLVVATLNIRIAVNPKTSLSEVVMIGCLLHHQFHIDKAPPQPVFQQHFCDQPWPYDVRDVLANFKGTKLEKSDSERSLLGFFMAKLSKIDPDLIVGHDLCGYGLDILVHRLFTNKIPQWSRLGRLRRGNPAVKQQVERNSTCGRLLCDVKISAKELIRARSYDLGTLCQNVLHLPEGERTDFTMEEVKKMYSSSKTVIQLISTTMQDAAYTVRLMCELNVLPLALQITNIAGNVMSRTLMGGRSERNEFLLLHAFTEKGFIVPDKQYKKTVVQEDFDEEDENGPGYSGRSYRKKKAVRGRRRPAYAGGMVLEPKKGFYDKMILLMDFNSLYPSIIQEYNICFTTVPQAAVAVDEGEEEPDLPLPEAGTEPGVLPTEIRKLVESRREVKKLMNSPDTPRDLKLQYNIRQTALKLTANSMYGCLGFSNSRFFAKPLAALVTAKGREILMNTKDLVEKLNFEVIYGDTDSLMINTNCVDYDQVFKIGHKIKSEVNRMYRQVELDIDGVFKYMLLLKKKKYAAVTITRLTSGEFVTQQEVKGLDIVRRDWSQLSAEAGKYVLKQILSDLGPDERLENIHGHLMKLRDDLENGLVPLLLLTITKQLTKNAEDYVDKKSMPHVQVALRINSRGGKKIRQGDTVEYIICEDGSNLPAMQRAYHVDELKANENLKVDVKYYLAQQIHPVVSRLCEPIEGTDSARIAECLGLDPSSYHRTYKNYQSDEQDMSLGEKTCLSDEERYKNCDRFKFSCMNESCKEEITLGGVTRKVDGVEYLSLEKCTNPQCSVSPIQYLPSIQNKLMLTIRGYIHKYYQVSAFDIIQKCKYLVRMHSTHWKSGCTVSGHTFFDISLKEKMYRLYLATDLFKRPSWFCSLRLFCKVEWQDSGYGHFSTINARTLTLFWSAEGYLELNKVQDIMLSSLLQ